MGKKRSHKRSTGWVWIVVLTVLKIPGVCIDSKYSHVHWVVYSTLLLLPDDASAHRYQSEQLRIFLFPFQVHTVTWNVYSISSSSHRTHHCFYSIREYFLNGLIMAMCQQPHHKLWMVAVVIMSWMMVSPMRRGNNSSHDKCDYAVWWWPSYGFNRPGRLLLQQSWNKEFYIKLLG